MNKKTIIFLIVPALLITCAYFIFFAKNDKGMVLGSSINSFYLQKISNKIKPPQKRVGVSDPKIYAESAILVHEPSMYFLYSKNEEKQVPIASITKIMTAIVSLENYKLSDIIEIKPESTKVTPSVMKLAAGEKITVENLLYGLLLNSGNDAALSLATGKFKQEDFINLMNKKAKELGLNSTKFMDPAGLDDSGRSTARDVAILFSYALKNEQVKKVISTSKTSVSSVDNTYIHELENSNRLTTGEIPMDGVIGGKTGYTPDAGHTLVCAASKNDQLLISVVLNTISNTPSASADETKKILSWGFESFEF